MHGRRGRTLCPRDLHVSTQSAASGQTVRGQPNAALSYTGRPQAGLPNGPGLGLRTAAAASAHSALGIRVRWDVAVLGGLGCRWPPLRSHVGPHSG